MANFLDMFIPLQKQLNAVLGWSTDNAKIFVNSITATDWNGTVIYGNDQDGQILKASTFGNDELHAGSGAGVTLYAGSGVNALYGGSGGNTFYANNGLAAANDNFCAFKNAA